MSEQLNSYIWKSNKTVDTEGKYVQSEFRMVDMSEKELNNAYNHCKTMLFNKDPQNPGRYLVLNIISDQRNRCGAELFLRYAEQKMDSSRVSLISAINEFKQNNRKQLAGIRPTINIVFSNLPEGYDTVPLDLVLDGCLDRLGALNKKHITRTFILRQGVWLTPDEAKDLTEYDYNNEVIDKIHVIRERLGVKDVEKLSINSKGLSYTELRSMMMLKPNKKYRDLTTAQLETLRNKILYILEETVRNHIDAWEERMIQIEAVSKAKSYKLS